MALYTISDLHLSTLGSTNKSMEVFGQRWQNYISRIECNWRALVTENDTVIIPGDISWALTLDEAESDLKFIDALPGKKLLGKGNHDFWWMTMAKHKSFFEEKKITTIDFLYNNAYECEDYIIAGSRGWFFDQAQNMPKNTDFDKLINREKMRLKMSLDAAMTLKENAPLKEILVFMHFPPYREGAEVREFTSLIKEYGVKRVFYGHIHGAYSAPPFETHDGVQYINVACDYLKFIPKIIN